MLYCWSWTRTKTWTLLTVQCIRRGGIPTLWVELVRQDPHGRKLISQIKEGKWPHVSLCPK